MRNDGVAPCLRGGALAMQRRGRLEIAGCVHWKYYSDAHSQGRSVLHLSCQLRRIEPMLGACSSMRIYIAFSKCRHTGLNRLYINQTRNSGGVRDATPVCTERIRTPRTEMTSRAGIRGLKHRTMDMVLYQVWHGACLNGCVRWSSTMILVFLLGATTKWKRSQRPASASPAVTNCICSLP